MPAGGPERLHLCQARSACADGVDDVAYTRALLADLGRRIAVDGRRVFASGFSNGAAMTQRLGCEAAETFAAIASVSGENQFALAGCTPAARVAVLDIHGTLDKCWPYDGGDSGCLLGRACMCSVAGDPGRLKSPARNGCDATPVTTTLPPRPGVHDGTSVVRFSYASCGAGGELEHLEVIGNGHYWPDGEAYASGRRLGGVMSRQLDTGPAIVEFFSSHSRP